MNDLNILKEVGLKEVSRKTHIEPEFLQYIVDRDYEKLLRVNVSGYIKILQREYSLDLSEWLDEYGAYKKENKHTQASLANVSPTLEVYTPNGSHSRLSANSLGWLLWLVLIVGFLIASYFFDAHKYIEQLPNIFDDKNRTTTYSDASVVVEVKKNINATQEITKEINLTKQDSATPVASIKQEDQNLSLLANSASLDKQEQNITAQKEPEVKILEPETPKPLPIGRFLAKPQSAKIEPKTKVWLGVIDLKTGKKRSFTTSSEYILDLNGEFLIACGNSNILLKTDGVEHRFDPVRAARFLIKNGEISFLNYDEFLSLNGGKPW